MVAGQIAIQQVAQHPLRARVPVHFTQVNQVAGQPHPGMVVHIAGVVQLAHRQVNGCNAGAGLQNIDRHLRQIGVIGQETGVNGLPDANPEVFPHMPVVGAPAQLKHQFVLGAETMLCVDAVVHLRQA